MDNLVWHHYDFFAIGDEKYILFNISVKFINIFFLLKIKQSNKRLWGKLLYISTVTVKYLKLLVEEN